MESVHSNLIIGFLQGTLSVMEKERFYAWLDADIANKELYFEIKAIYDASRSQQMPPVNLQESWSRLLTKQRIRTYRFPLLRKVMPYVAVAMIAVALTSLLFIQAKDKSTVVATQYIGGDGLEADVVVLPDGSRVSLGTKTNLQYNSDYGKINRLITLDGEAYFEVAQQKNKPFIVEINGQKIEALGTKFNVMAYTNDSLFITTLLQGAVRLFIESHSKYVDLHSDQQLVYNRNTENVDVFQVDAEQFIAWTTGYYYFPEQRLESILYRLSHVLGVEFTVRSNNLNNTVFTGTFYRGQSIKDIMEIINLSIPIHYYIDERHVTISD